MISSEATGATISLRSRLLAGASWSMVGYVLGQVIRLASNLLLTHLLAPEHFGLMALVNVLMIGLNMFSDIGIGPSIIQSGRGTDQRYLDTAWTLQFLRGCAMWACCFVAAWPFARFYEQASLAWIVPVAGLSAVIAGLNSTKVFTVQREIDLRRLTMLELGSQAVTAAAMIAFASVMPSVWALVFGALFGAAIKMVGSHVFLPGANNRFVIEPAAAGELLRFGRWIFVSTILSFTTSSAASLILGKFLTMAEVGIFSIACTLSKAVEQAFDQINGRVLLPAFARIKSEPLPQLRARILRLRCAVMAAFIPPLLFLAIFGQQVMDLLFDPRYHNGGWILQLFSACAIPIIVTGVGQFALAKGNSALVMVMSAARLVFYVGSSIAGWLLGGANGIIVGIAVHSFLTYAAELAVQRYYAIHMPWLDAAAFGVSAAVLVAGLAIIGIELPASLR